MFLIPIVISTIFSLLSAFVTFLNTHASQVSEKDLEKLEYKQDIGFYFVSILINKKKKIKKKFKNKKDKRKNSKFNRKNYKNKKLKEI